MPGPFLVTGATGSQGGSCARALLAAGHAVHALTRDPSSAAALALQKQGALLFRGSFEDAASLRAAIAAGVEGVFFNPAPSWTDNHDAEDPTGQIGQARALVDALGAAGSTAKTVVASTVLRASQHGAWSEEDPLYPLAAYYAAKAGVEAVLREAGFENLVVLRPPFLMQNLLPESVGTYFPQLLLESEGQEERVLATASWPGTRMAFADAADVGRLGARALMEPGRFGGREIEVGAESLTWAQAAERLGKVAGVQVKVRHLGEQEVRAILPSVPAQSFMAWANGHDLHSVDDVADFGIRMTSLEEFLEREREGVVAMLGGKK